MKHSVTLPFFDTVDVFYSPFIAEAKAAGAMVERNLNNLDEIFVIFPTAKDANAFERAVRPTLGGMVEEDDS